MELKRLATFLFFLFLSSNLNCEIIAGSIRSQGDVSDAGDNGCDIVTCSTAVIKSMTKHPKTDASVEGFLNDFKNWIK